ncbi:MULTISPECIES: hypothetical protein [Flammeovirga]|uniref:Uncharacterized protein n=1 Tax=Flammeovirga agarivorans TaxID=2726742 RepID=A0A7X8SII9_9BACT|nr:MULTISPECIES: hypothetical protein [Flammeovirga]NLR90913.1 hypothetical protein [Flammeovirga agarivorans]
MKNFISILLPILITFNTEAGGPEEDGIKKDTKGYDYMNTAPKVGYAPFIQGVAKESSLDLIKERRKHFMLIDSETDNILFQNLVEGKDFIRVYKDPTDNKDCIIIWRILKEDKDTGKIRWKKFTYKKFETIGWRPVDNRTTKVKAFD